MNYRSLVGNAATAFLAQGVAMLLSIIQTLLVPKLLGTTQYGYWQLFIFYASYVGFAHLGLNDGVYLIKGGQSRNVIDKKSVNSQFVFGVAFQLVCALLILVVAIMGGFGPDRAFVIACTGVFLVIQNAASYLMFVLQAMNETKRSSYAVIVERLAFLLPLAVLLIVRWRSYQPFVIAYIVSSVIQLGFCLWLCRDFVHAGLKSLRTSASESWASICVGFKLMIANVASLLVLGVARFAVDVVWGIDVFGELSLALSMAGFFLAFVSQAAMVLFPALRQVDFDEIRRFFRNVRDAMALFFPVIYILYYPLVWLLSLWLPAYAESFVYFAFLIPLCLFDSKMNICCTTFFKVLRQEGLLLRVNIWTCSLSVLLTFFGVFIFQSIFAVIGGLVIVIVGRSIWAELRLSKELDMPFSYAAMCGELVLTVVFMTTAMLMPSSGALLVFCCAYAVYLVFFRNRARELVAAIFRVLKRT